MLLLSFFAAEGVFVRGCRKRRWNEYRVPRWWKGVGGEDSGSSTVMAPVVGWFSIVHSFVSGPSGFLPEEEGKA